MEGILNCTIPGIKICILWRQIAGSALLAAVLACLYIFAWFQSMAYDSLPQGRSASPVMNAQTGRVVSGMFPEIALGITKPTVEERRGGNIPGSESEKERGPECSGYDIFGLPSGGDAVDSCLPIWKRRNAREDHIFLRKPQYRSRCFSKTQKAWQRIYRLVSGPCMYHALYRCGRNPGEFGVIRRMEGIRRLCVR